MAAVLSIFKSVVVSLILFTCRLSSCNGSGSVQGDYYYRVELIHRESARSPLMKPHMNLTTAERVRLSVERSKKRLGRLQSMARGGGGNNFYSPVMPNDGGFIMRIGIGHPTPLLQHMILDTGSDLIWLQCKPCAMCYSQEDPLYDLYSSSSYKTLSCQSKFCTESVENFCDPPNICGYFYSYGDGATTTGNMASEIFSLKRSSAISSAWEALPSPLAFGCGHRQEGGPTVTVPGLVGLARGVISLPSQLGKTIKNKFSYCLGPIDDDAGVSSLILGEAPLPGKFQSTPFLRASNRNNYDPRFYYLDLHGISVGGTMVKYPAATFQRGGLIIDSGSTQTSMPDPAYEPFMAAVKSRIRAKPVNEPASGYDHCYYSSQVVLSKLPRIAFHFAGNATFVVPPRNSFDPAEVNGRQLQCFAYSSSGGEGKISIFGNTQQQNFNIVYDLGKNKLSFAPAVCDNL